MLTSFVKALLRVVTESMPAVYIAMRIVAGELWGKYLLLTKCILCINIRLN